MRKILISFLNCIRGATAVEYGIVGVLLVAVIAASMSSLGVSLDLVISAANNGLINGQ
jgi:Flp pilus assembly pilin Flp